tara:strand:+ start:482 stop:631 length:150 start_codon:yes stop_codon:yes gene_type:complete
MMGMSLTDFWSSSITEITLATNGFMEFHGSKKESMSRDELNDMMEMYPD